MLTVTGQHVRYNHSYNLLFRTFRFHQPFNSTGRRLDRLRQSDELIWYCIDVFFPILFYVFGFLMRVVVQGSSSNPYKTCCTRGTFLAYSFYRTFLAQGYGAADVPSGDPWLSSNLGNMADSQLRLRPAKLRCASRVVMLEVVVNLTSSAATRDSLGKSRLLYCTIIMLYLPVAHKLLQRVTIMQTKLIRQTFIFTRPEACFLISLMLAGTSSSVATGWNCWSWSGGSALTAHSNMLILPSHRTTCTL